jgi:excinuclease UvrABC nuclease subunit
MGYKTTFKPSKYSKPGTYLIKSKQTGDIIYVGYSATNLYKTLYRHFQTWNDSAQNRFVYDRNKYTVRVILTIPTRAAQLEKALILKYKPRDNKNKHTSQELNFQEVQALQDYFSTETEAPF